MRERKVSDQPILEVEVTPELCLNFRNCTRIAPGAFVTDPKTGKTRAALWERAAPEALWQAGWSCPTGAIRVRTAQGWLVPRWDEAARWDTDHHPAASAKAEEPPPKW